MAVASRLKGRPYRLAMSLRIVDPRTGDVYVGDTALAFTGYHADPALGLPETPSGLNTLIMLLQSKYGAEEQRISTRAIDSFENLVRSDRMSLLDYLNEYEFLYNQAVDLADYSLSDVARTHRLLKGARLDRTVVDHILLLENYDKRRYDAIYAHLMKRAKTSEPSQLPAYGSSYLGEVSGYPSSSSHGWTPQDESDSMYSGHDWPEYFEEFDTPSSYYGDSYYGEEDASEWYQDEWTEESADWYPEEYSYDWYEESWGDDWNPEAAYYGGKGKGKSFRRPKGKGKSKGFSRFSKGKGKGKSKAGYAPREPRPSYEVESSASSSALFGKGGKVKATSAGRSSGMMGCSVCGSANHNDDSCPWHGSQPSPKGKGKSKSKDKSGHAHFVDPPASNPYAWGTVEPSATPSTVPSRAQVNPGSAATFVNVSSRALANPSTGTYLTAPAQSATRRRPLYQPVTLDLVTEADEAEDSSRVASAGHVFTFLCTRAQVSAGVYMMGAEKKKPAANVDTPVDSQGIMILHTVQGKPRQGLIYDPGAPHAIGGTDTLLGFVRETGLSFTPLDGDGAFKGIDAVDIESRMKARVPFKIAGRSWPITVHTLGGSGSSCPFLLPNSALEGATTVHSFFPNGDALLALVDPSGQIAGVRMCRTDSGHHMVIHDDPRSYDDDARRILDASRPRKSKSREMDQRDFTDSSHVNSKDSRSGPRGLHAHVDTPHTPEEFPIGDDFYIGDDDEVIDGDVYSMDWTLKRPPGLDEPQNGSHAYHSPYPRTATDSSHTPVFKSSDKLHTPVSSPAEETVTHSLTHDAHASNVEVFKVSNEDDICSLCGIRENTTTMTICVICERHVCLGCSVQGSCKTCHETVSGATDIPIETLLTGATQLTRHISDEELKRFKLDANGILVDWCSDYYTGDTFPENTSDTTKFKMSRLPEEYYSRHRTPVLRPTNAMYFIELHARFYALVRKEMQFDFQELWSCSARLSNHVRTAGGKTLGPIDYRYGWDLNKASHRSLVMLLNRIFKIKVTHASPDCRIWSCASNRADEALRAMERASQEAMLQWLVNLCKSIDRDHRAACVEQPWSSAAWRLSPLANLNLPKHRVSQCRHGAQHTETKLPVRKDTCFATKLRMRSIFKVCDGSHKHSVLEGKCKKTGLNHTTLASVYPKVLCRRLASEFMTFARKCCDHELGHEHHDTQVHESYWACEKCNLGDAAPPELEHTRVYGECRQYGVPGRLPRLLPPSRGRAPTITAEDRNRIREHSQGRRADAHASASSSSQPASSSSAAPAAAAPVAAPAANTHSRPSALRRPGRTPQAAEPARPSPDDPGPPSADPGEEPGALAPVTEPVVTVRALRTTLKELKECEFPSHEFNQRILWLHSKFWHASVERLTPLLTFAGLDKNRLAMLPEIIKLCDHCNDYAGLANRPQIRVSLSPRFNHTIECDHFQHNGINFLLIVDRCFKFKGGDAVTSTSTEECIRVLLMWVKTYGPPQHMVTDQGSSLASTELGSFCDKFNIRRDFGGADASRPAQHTATGLVEKSVDLMRHTMNLLVSEAAAIDLDPTPSELFSESCIAHNMLLTYSGTNPATGVFGVQGILDMFDMDSQGVEDTDPRDACERALRMRHFAKIATLRAVVEYRIARANHTRNVRVDSPCQPGDIVDMYRRPASKDLPGWRGPCVVLSQNPEQGTVVVQWQGRPWLMAKRHLRAHRGYLGSLYVHSTCLASFPQWINHVPDMKVSVFNLNPGPSDHVSHANQSPIFKSSSVKFADQSSTPHTVFYVTGTATPSYPVNLSQTTLGKPNHLQESIISLMKLQDRVDGGPPGHSLTFGQIHDDKRMKLIFVNSMVGSTLNLQSDLEKICQCYVHNFPFQGIRCGTQCSTVPPVHHSTFGHIIIWSRGDRSNYVQQQVKPWGPLSLSTILAGTSLSPASSSFVMFYTFADLDDEANPYLRDPEYELPNLDDADNHLRKLEDVDMSPADSPHAPPGMPDIPMSPDVSIRTSSTGDASMGDNSPDDKFEVKQELIKELAQKLKKLDEEDSNDAEPSSSSGINRGPVLPLINENDIPMDPSPTVTMESDLPAPSSPETRGTSSTSTSPELVSDTSTIPYEDDVQEISYETASALLANELHCAVLDSYERSVYHVRDHFNESPSSPSSSSTAKVPLFHDVLSDSSSIYQAMSGEIFRVESDTDNLTVDDLYHYESEVFAADSAEVQQFIANEVWQPTRLQDHSNIIDCTWVRKWKFKHQAYNVKSRLCCRGCFDRQKSYLLKSASVASRLSQRILLSNASRFNWPTESWDVSAAFLQGLTFQEVERTAAELGVPSPLTEREIVIKLPGNVWFHLFIKGAITRKQYDEARAGRLGMLLLKPMYGLSDAPLLWQLALRHHLITQMGAIVSHYDENHFYFKERDARGRTVLTGEATCHVDDTVFSGDSPHLNSRRTALERRFGAISRQTLPFTHVGIEYNRLQDGGYHLHQANFCMAIRPAHVERGNGNETPLGPKELSAYRSVLGALLYLCITRADVAVDVVLLASRISKATFADLRAANSLVKRAQQNPTRGLVYPRLQGPLAVFSISDSSFSTSSTSYAVEGNAVLLMPLHKCLQTNAYTELNSATLSTHCHLLAAQSKKAKRVSHSTSHAESLSMYSGLQLAETVAMRYTETQFPFCYSPTVENLISIEEWGRFELPIIACTDCNDLVDLLTGQRGTPQDKSQRLIILSLRERRLIGKTSATMWQDTRDMLANPLTKKCSSSNLDAVLTHGWFEMHFKAKFYPAPKSLFTLNYDEEDLLKGESSLLRDSSTR